ncbi:MAG: hypothetical protein RTU92_02095 [Candidatus Thorarchaeota archaeon]
MEIDSDPTRDEGQQQFGRDREYNNQYLMAAILGSLLLVIDRLGFLGFYGQIPILSDMYMSMDFIVTPILVITAYFLIGLGFLTIYQAHKNDITKIAYILFFIAPLLYLLSRTGIIFELGVSVSSLYRTFWVILFGLAGAALWNIRYEIKNESLGVVTSLAMFAHAAVRVTLLFLPPSFLVVYIVGIAAWIMTAVFFFATWAVNKN